MNAIILTAVLVGQFDVFAADPAPSFDIFGEAVVKIEESEPVIEAPQLPPVDLPEEKWKVEPLVYPPPIESRQAPRGSVICLIVSKGCNPCIRAEWETLPALKSQGWIVKEYGDSGSANIWIMRVGRDDVEIERYGDAQNGNPQWAFVDGGISQRVDIGFKNAQQVKAFFDSREKRPVQKKKPAPKQMYAQAHGPLYYSSRWGSSWTWPGDLRQHLRSEHGINTDNMSDAQCVAMHDRSHNSAPRSGGRGLLGGLFW